jgi:hypothetical protein
LSWVSTQSDLLYRSSTDNPQDADRKGRRLTSPIQWRPCNHWYWRRRQRRSHCTPRHSDGSRVLQEENKSHHKIPNLSTLEHFCRQPVRHFWVILIIAWNWFACTKVHQHSVPIITTLRSCLMNHALLALFFVTRNVLCAVQSPTWVEYFEEAFVGPRSLLPSFGMRP